MPCRGKPWVCLVISLLASVGCKPTEAKPRSSARAVPVETAPVEHGDIEARRTFTGTLDPFAELTVASKIGGLVEKVRVDLGDPVPAGEPLVLLDDDELRQAVVLASAEVKVAEAKQAEADNALAMAKRELERIEPLHAQGLTSDAVLDSSRSAVQTAAAALEMARGGFARAKAELTTAKIRLGYATIASGELEGGGTRVVSDRLVNPGDTVAANAPLLRTVEIDPLIAAISVTEHDYAQLRAGRQASLATDAMPDREFQATVERIAPTFDEASRQARVELRVDNAELLLKPGAFARVTLVLDGAQDATIVPEAALTRRAGTEGVFVVSADGKRVAFRPVRVGIRDGDRVQVIGEGITGRVVTLGQQQLEDGASIVLPAEPVPTPAQAATEQKTEG